MIKINLLTVERKVAKKKIAFGTGQKMVIGCSAILVLTGLFVGWRYWQLGQDSKKLDDDIAKAQQEAARLHSIIAQVQQFEQQKAQLQQRVLLIEQLRKEQTGPVHILDQVSRALPPMVWLLSLKQTPENPNEVLIVGRCTNLTGLSDFAQNLENSGYFKKSVEILNSKAEPTPQPPGQLIEFSIRAKFQRPGEAEKEKADAEKAVGTSPAAAAGAKRG